MDNIGLWLVAIGVGLFTIGLIIGSNLSKDIENTKFKHPLKPIIELHINQQNEVDTFYIYKFYESK